MPFDKNDPRVAPFVPRPERSTTVVTPPVAGEGHWAGAPSAVVADGFVYLAYRMRRPIGQGRGYAVVVARSTDGERFETLSTIFRGELEAESLERPTLVKLSGGGWRLYLSCATYATKHWRVEAIEADDPARFSARKNRSTVLPGDASTAVKDTVIVRRDNVWHLWASCHPTDPYQADRMTTDYATSADGLDWTWHGTALQSRPGKWDSRGVRVSAVRFLPEGVLAFYDGRSSAAENFEERTGIAFGADPTSLVPVGGTPAAKSPHRGGGLRYLDVVDLSDGGRQLFYEYTCADGTHELRTEVRPAG
ncbi:MAG: hypothetical protein ACRDXX_18605 [Stackebrandtia sp.]